MPSVVKVASLPKRRRVDVGRRQDGLVQVLSGPRIVVVVGEHAGIVADVHRRRRRLLPVGRRHGHRVRAGRAGRCVQPVAVIGPARGRSSGDAVDRPGHAARAAADRELLRLSGVVTTAVGGRSR